uniref:F-box/FBD/LRR-repeat protein n=1 Tax=Panagrellus redivivus TaxID=6233 RepID=A0A7E4VDC3_PANRE
MPYPIAKLAYGLRCRLAELAIPFERYNLQIAAGDVSICPSKRQLLRKRQHYSLDFVCENGNVSVSKRAIPNNTPFVYTENCFFECTDGIALYNFDLPDLTSETMGHFLLRPHKVGLHHCNISKPFLEVLSKTSYTHVTHFYIHNQNHRCIISLADIITAFPRIRYLVLSEGYLTDNWLTDLLPLQNSSLEVLRIYVNSDQFKKVKKEQLLTFLKAQRQGFSLAIKILGSGKHLKFYFLFLNEFLNRKLNKFETNPPPPMKYTRIAITYRDVLSAWFLPVYTSYGLSRK